MKSWLLNGRPVKWAKRCEKGPTKRPGVREWGAYGRKGTHRGKNTIRGRDSRGYLARV